MPITWKNVNAPNQRATNSLLDAGLDRIDQGLGKLSKQAKEISTEQEEDAATKREEMVNALKTDMANLSESELDQLASGDSSIGTENGLKAGELVGYAKEIKEKKAQGEIVDTQRDILKNTLQTQKQDQAEAPVVNDLRESIASVSDSAEDSRALLRELSANGTFEKIRDASPLISTLQSNIRAAEESELRKVIQSRTLKQGQDADRTNTLVNEARNRVSRGEPVGDVLQEMYAVASKNNYKLPSNLAQDLESVDQQSKKMTGELKNSYLNDTSSISTVHKSLVSSQQPKIDAYNNYKKNNAELLDIANSTISREDRYNAVGTAVDNLATELRGSSTWDYFATDVLESGGEVLDAKKALNTHTENVVEAFAKARGIRPEEVPMHANFIDRAMRAAPNFEEDNAFTEGDDDSDVKSFKEALETELAKAYDAKIHLKGLERGYIEAQQNIANFDKYAQEAGRDLTDYYHNLTRSNRNKGVSSKASVISPFMRFDSAKKLKELERKYLTNP